MIARLKDAHHLFTGEDIRGKPTYLSGKSRDITIIADPAHVFAELCQDGVFVIDCTLPIIYPGCSPLLNLLFCDPYFPYLLMQKKIVQLKKKPLGP